MEIFEYHILAKPDGYKRFVAIDGGGGLAHKLIHAAHYVGNDEIAQDHADGLAELNGIEFKYRRCKTNMFPIRGVTIQARREHDTYGVFGPVTIEMPYASERMARHAACKILASEGFEIAPVNPGIYDIG